MSEALDAALADGQTQEPGALFAILAEVENPIASLCDFDQANRLFDALHDDFGFLRRPTTGPAFSPDETARWTSLLRWLIRELRTWPGAGDARSERLAALLVVAQANDRDGCLWKLLPDDVVRNEALHQSLGKVVGSFRMTYTSRWFLPVPIWERETVERLEVAEASGNWVDLAESWRPFDHQILPNTLQIQTTRYLFRSSVDTLLHSLHNQRQMGIASAMAAALTQEQKLRLAIATSNPTIRFCCLFKALSDQKRSEPFSHNEQMLLTELLSSIAGEAARWEEAMRVFNAYPSRYPVLQMALGKALSTASEQAVEAYVGSIMLQPVSPGADLGRRQVADCLDAFRASAVPEHRRALWTAAHDRWRKWGFGGGKDGNVLVNVCWSQLDYAIVGYATECLDDPGRERALDTLRQSMDELDHQWTESVTAFYDRWNRLASQFQPFAHAVVEALHGADWFQHGKLFYPFDPAADTYLALKYQVFSGDTPMRSDADPGSLGTQSQTRPISPFC